MPGKLLDQPIQQKHSWRRTRLSMASKMSCSRLASGRAFQAFHLIPFFTAFFTIKNVFYTSFYDTEHPSVSNCPALVSSWVTKHEGHFSATLREREVGFMMLLSFSLSNKVLLCFSLSNTIFFVLFSIKHDFFWCFSSIKHDFVTSIQFWALAPNRHNPSR
jgi:hypothetical protein